jgi:hypothetical protein
MQFMKVFSLALFSIPLGAVHAQAAVTKATLFACRDQADTQAAAKLKAGVDKKASAGFEASKLAGGACMQIAANTAVTIDQRGPSLFCIRPPGALECYWAASSSIDAAAAEPAKPKSSCSMQRGSSFSC